MKTSVKLILIYFVMQVLGAMIAAPVGMVYSYLVYSQPSMDAVQPEIMSLAMLFGFLFMGYYLWRKGYLKNDGRLYSPVSVACLMLSLTAGVSVVFLSDFVMSGLRFLPDWLHETFGVLQSNVLGLLCVTLLGPVMEELLFRGAVTKVLLGAFRPSTAILLSGLMFGIFHINPAQVVAASLSGIFLAWLYYRTRSLIPGILIHVLNNTLSVYLDKAYPEADSLRQLLGESVYLFCLAASTLLLMLSLLLLNRYEATGRSPHP